MRSPLPILTGRAGGVWRWTWMGRCFFPVRRMQGNIRSASRFPVTGSVWRRADTKEDVSVSRSSVLTTVICRKWSMSFRCSRTSRSARRGRKKGSCRILRQSCGGRKPRGCRTDRQAASALLSRSSIGESMCTWDLTVSFDRDRYPCWWSWKGRQSREWRCPLPIRTAGTLSP